MESGVMDRDQGDQADQIAAIHPADAAKDEKKADMVPSEEDAVNVMTLNTGIRAAAGKPGEVVATQPLRAIPGAKPENYVTRLENLGESPDFIDCPYCRTRQKTKVSHESTSQTT